VTGLGFEPDRALAALHHCEGDITAAVEMLVRGDNIPNVNPELHPLPGSSGVQPIDTPSDGSGIIVYSTTGVHLIRFRPTLLGAVGGYRFALFRLSGHLFNFPTIALLFFQHVT